MPICILLLLVIAPVVAFAQPRFDLATTQTRLPKVVLPTRVKLALELDPNRDAFTGQVRIQLRALQAVPAIVLHARALDADAAEIFRAGGRPRALEVLADAKAQTWRLVPKDGNPIDAGAWTLQIRYRGQIQTTGEGLYRAEYKINGSSTRMLGTQLEAVQARRLLPLFDEPVFRCVFELEVRAPRGLQVLSNMPAKQTSSEGAMTRHRFTPTPPMASYLLAVTIGRFDVLEAKSDGIPLRIFTAPGKREQARFAMEVTRQVLPYYARYFGVPYALPKLDQIAVPGTRQGAMEDWGVISYIEDALLFDPARSDEDTRRLVFSIAAHEIAHQWFGNLVSAASWDEIWLNEAFATWMERKASVHFHPEWQTALRQRRQVDRTMARDATRATRAIRSGPVSEDSVFDVFDGVTYDKGGAVLSMLEEWLGEATFQRGLAAYMAERAFKPATAGDLWHHMARAAKLPMDAVAAVAASWTDQPGLPVLKVTQRCDAGQTLVTLQQSRFSSLAEPIEGGPWQIPLRLSRGTQTQALLMKGAQETVALPGCQPLPLVANAGGRGYYRVEYELELRGRMAQAFATLAPADRVTLLSDSYALANAGQQSMTDHLALLGALPQVPDNSRAALFAQGLTHWHDLDLALDGTPAQERFRAAGRSLFGPELERLGWQVGPGEDGETKTMRSDLIKRLARFGHGPTLAKAHALFRTSLANDASVPPSIRAALLYAVGCDASEAEFDALLAALRSTDSQEERWNLLAALSAGTDPVRARRLLDESLSGRLPSDISSSLPGAVGEQPSLSPMAYDFVVSHWGELSRLAGEGSFGGRYWLLPDAARSSSDPTVARTLVIDQQRLAGPAGNAAAARTAAGVESRSRLRERVAPALAASLGD